VSAGAVGPAPAGYSGTPLVRKLGIKPGSRVALVGAPEDFEEAIEPLPEGAAVRRRLRGPQDVILCFATSRSALVRALPRLRAAMSPACGLWVAWPKRASGVPTDLTENVIRDEGAAAGLVDNKVCAIDEVWSGLRLVIRLRDRPGG
jgi:hypothetical protein